MEYTWSIGTEYIEKISGPSFLGTPFIYIDESGFDLAMHKSKGRSPSGEPATLSVCPKGKRITLIAALSREGIIAKKLVESLGKHKKGTTTDDFCSFLYQFVSKSTKRIYFGIR